jgi:hypothetical protein
MGTRTPNSREWWEKEVGFIEEESAKSYRMGSFDSYCGMQHNFAIKDGFPELADRIKKACEKTRSIKDGH